MDELLETVSQYMPFGKVPKNYTKSYIRDGQMTKEPTST